MSVLCEEVVVGRVVRSVGAMLGTGAVVFSVLGVGSVWVHGTTVGIPVVEDCVAYSRDTASGMRAGFPWVADVSRVDWLGSVQWRVPECDAMKDVYVAGNGAFLRLEDRPSDVEVAQMDPSGSPYRLRIPAVGVDVGLREMSTYMRGGERVINPPTLEDAYVVRDWALPGDARESMMVIAVHSAKSLPDSAGSKLIDIASGGARVGVGDRLEVDSLVYEVRAVHVQDKKRVPESGVWVDEPGKLLIFTCLQRPGGRSVQNVIVEAHLVEAGG